MAGICSKHHPDIGPVAGCDLCDVNPEDVISDYKALLERAKTAGLTRCRHCNFEFYKTVNSCPACGENAHHIWCNHFLRPLSDCKMCDDLWKKYPYDDEGDGDELAAKHFPNAVERK